MEFRHRSIERFATGIDDDGPLRVQPIQVKADGLADAPPDTVAHDGFAERARHGKADMGSVGLRLADDRTPRTEGRHTAEPVVVNPAKILGSQQTDTFRKTRDGRLPLGADGQFLAAARAAAGQNGAAVLGLHTGAEPVGLGAVTVIRLKSTFRHFSSSI